jgi:hypothetical protein
MWSNHSSHGASSHAGTCKHVNAAFGLCPAKPERECLVARVPWQTALSVVRCCFHCCQIYWQDRLGLSAIYKHWWQNPKFSGIGFDSHFQKELQPSLHSIVMHNYMIKRFSLFMYSRGSFLNATHLVEKNGGGGVVWAHGPYSQDWYRDGQLFDNATLAYINTHPVSVVHTDDTFKPITDFAETWLKGFPNGGHFFTTNRWDDASELSVAIPQGYSAAQKDFESDLGNLGANRQRTNLLMCCCMSDRGGRYKKVEKLMKMGVCSDEGTAVKGVGFREYFNRLSNSKFVLSPSGNGFACYRDLEAVVAGAVTVLDGFLSGGKHLFDSTFPAIHVPVDITAGRGAPVPVYTQEITAAWLEAEYAKIEARRDELDVAKLFWPYWMYHVFEQVPDCGA